MKRHIGTKIVNATPMSRADYNTFRGWTLPADENGADDGYLVEYLDGGAPNTPHYAGYVSWSPKAQFDAAYRETTGLTFGMAIEALKAGQRVARAGWNGKGMWLALVNGENWGIGGLAPYDRPGAAHVSHAPFIGMKTADNKFIPWLASQTDVLAEDWTIAESAASTEPAGLSGQVLSDGDSLADLAGTPRPDFDSHAAAVLGASARHLLPMDHPLAETPTELTAAKARADFDADLPADLRCREAD